MCEFVCLIPVPAQDGVVAALDVVEGRQSSLMDCNEADDGSGSRRCISTKLG